jgi:hypothetical protein
MEYVYLQGSEDVQRAGNNIASSASLMQSASNNIMGALEQNQRFMTEWLDRFETVLKENKRSQL